MVEIDWIVIRVSFFKRLAAVLGALALLAVMLFGLHKLINPEPPVQAKRAIERAVKIEKRIDPDELDDTWREDFDEGQQLLESARQAYAEDRFSDAVSDAHQASQRFSAVEGSIGGVGQLRNLNGRVHVQGLGESNWKAARESMPVYNGDSVRTGSDGRVEIVLIDGTIYELQPGSLLEINLKRTSLTQNQFDGQIVVEKGRVDVETGGAQSNVAGVGAETSIEADTRAQIEVSERDGRKDTTTRVYQGGAEVSSDTGSVRLASMEQVKASDDGTISEKRRIPPPPMLTQPAPRERFGNEPDERITLTWESVVSGSYHLQVAADPQFRRPDIDREGLEKTRARIQPVRPGTYYWRVAMVDDQDMRSDWSRYQVFLIADTTGSVSRGATKPIITVTSLRQFDNIVTVAGVVSADAELRVNGEVVPTNADGSFSKTIELRQAGINDIVFIATNPAGLTAEVTEKVNVEGI